MPSISVLLEIGRRLPKSYGYYEWCEYHHLDPDTLEEVKE